MFDNKCIHCNKPILPGEEYEGNNIHTGECADYILADIKEKLMQDAESEDFGNKGAEEFERD